MDSDQTHQDEKLTLANELYWQSDQSVNQIAEDLDLSKGTLYQAVQALESDVDCPRCWSGLVYPNRTAREKGFLTCPECGFEGHLEEVQEGSGSARGSAGAASSAAEEGRRQVVIGAALLGAAAGLALAIWMRRR